MVEKESDESGIGKEKRKRTIVREIMTKEKNNSESDRDR